MKKITVFYKRDGKDRQMRKTYRTDSIPAAIKRFYAERPDNECYIVGFDEVAIK